MPKMIIFYPDGRREEIERAQLIKPDRFKYPVKTAIYIKSNGFTVGMWYIMGWKPSIFNHNVGPRHPAMILPAKMEWMEIKEENVDPLYRTWVLINP